MASKDNEITVFISSRSSTCEECKSELGRKAFIVLNDKKEALCLSCADLNHLEYLPSGNAALTRRSKKHSKLSAAVVKWSRTRKRYERQGLLVELEALEKAEEECLSEAKVEQNRRYRTALRRNDLDEKYIREFGKRVRELFPKCSRTRVKKIAEFACLKYSYHTGRNAEDKPLDESAVRIGVTSYIRHTLTDYDELLYKTGDRQEARQQVQEKVEEILTKWEDNI